jgi:hypothetical protein
VPPVLTALPETFERQRQPDSVQTGVTDQPSNPELAHVKTEMLRRSVFRRELRHD